MPNNEAASSGSGFSTRSSTNIRPFPISLPDTIPYLFVSSNFISSTEKMLAFFLINKSTKPLVQLGFPVQIVSPNKTANESPSTKFSAQSIACPNPLCSF